MTCFAVLRVYARRETRAAQEALQIQQEAFEAAARKSGKARADRSVAGGDHSVRDWLVGAYRDRLRELGHADLLDDYEALHRARVDSDDRDRDDPLFIDQVLAEWEEAANYCKELLDGRWVNTPAGI